MNAWLKQHGAEWLYRLAVIIGLIVIGWLNSRFATLEDLHRTESRVTAIETAIKVMIETNKVNDRQDEALRDHENRLRGLERAAK